MKDAADLWEICFKLLVIFGLMIILLGISIQRVPKPSKTGLNFSSMPHSLKVDEKTGDLILTVPMADEKSPGLQVDAVYRIPLAPAEVK